MTSSLKKLMACSTGIAVSSLSAVENMSPLCSLHSPIRHTKSSLLINLVRKMPLADRARMDLRRMSSMVCTMNSQLISVKSAWYFSRYS